MATHGQLPGLFLNKAISPNMSVNMGVTHIVIDRAKGAESHSVELLFDAPQISEPTMYVISGRRQILNQGWQCFLRGILIEPLEHL